MRTIDWQCPAGLELAFLTLKITHERLLSQGRIRSPLVSAKNINTTRSPSYLQDIQSQRPI